MPGVLEEHEGCSGVWRRVNEEEVRAGRWRSCRAVGAAGRTWAFTPGRREPGRAVGRGGVRPDSIVHVAL